SPPPPPAARAQGFCRNRPERVAYRFAFARSARLLTSRPAVERHRYGATSRPADYRKGRPLAWHEPRHDPDDVFGAPDGDAVDRNDRVAAGADVEPVVDHVVRARLQPRPVARCAARDAVDPRPLRRGVPEAAGDRRRQVLRLDAHVGVLDPPGLLELPQRPAGGVDRDGEADALEARARTARTDLRVDPDH